MDQVEALRTAARRFCIDQHARWGDEYLRLESNGGSRVNLGGIRWEYSSEAYSLFPRYRLDEAIQIEIEKLTGYRFQSVEQARQQFIDTARTELSRLCSEFHEKPEAIRALQSEMQAFESFVAQLQAAHLETVAPLPYRRVLGDTESKGLWEKLQAGWNAPSAGHYWYPLSDSGANLNVIAFHEGLWRARNGMSVLMRELTTKGIQRCFILRELGPPNFQADLSFVTCLYDGSESYITSDFSWLVYLSHESSITIAGWLADTFRSEWPDWEQVRYGGPFHTDDLRGSWNY